MGGKKRELAVLTVCLAPVEVETCFLSFCLAPSSGFCLPTPVLRGPMSLLTPASAHSARAAQGRQGGGVGAQASTPVFLVSEMMKETGTTDTSLAVTSFSKRPDVAKFPVDDYDCLF